MTAPTLTRAYRWAPPFTRTNGDIAAHVGEQVGLPPDVEQRWILDATFAERPDAHLPVAREVCIVAPRQNIKSSTLAIAAMTDLFVFRTKLHIWTAHEFDTAEKSFEDMRDRIENCDDFRRRCRKPRTGHGDMSIELLTGEKIEFHSRTGAAGRGVTGDRLTFDEWLYGRPRDAGAHMPTLLTRPEAQIRFGSSAGLPRSTELRRLRDRGRAGGDPGLVYVEYGAERRACLESPCSHLYGEVEGCALDDRDLWWQSNVALHAGRAAEDMVLFLRKAMPPEEFAREMLTWWDDPLVGEPVFGVGRWESCSAVKPYGLAVGGLGLAVSMDLTRATIAAAGRAGDRVHVKPLQHGPGTGWVVQAAEDLQLKLGASLVVDPRGPAGVLIPHLLVAGVRLIQPTGAQVFDSCASVFDMVREQTLRHGDYPELDGAVAVAVKRESGDRWAWGRRAAADISALEAVTLAAWAAQKPAEAPPLPTLMWSKRR